MNKRMAILNTRGLANKITLSTTKMWEYQINYMFVCETKYNTVRDTTSHPFIAASSRPPRGINEMRPTKHGCALLSSNAWQRVWKNHITVIATDTDGQFLVWNEDGVQFIGLYLPPMNSPESKSVALDIIDRAFEAANRRPRQHRIVCGDLNINIDHTATAERDYTIANGYQRDVMARLEELGLFPIAPSEGQYTRFDHPADEVGSCIDHFLCNYQAWTDLRPRVKIHDLAHQRDLLSDHVLVELEYSPIPGTVDHEQGGDANSYWRYNISKLHKPENYERFRDRYIALTENVDEWMYRDEAIRRILPESEQSIEGDLELVEDNAGEERHEWQRPPIYEPLRIMRVEAPEYIPGWAHTIEGALTNALNDTVDTADNDEDDTEEAVQLLYDIAMDRQVDPTEIMDGLVDYNEYADYGHIAHAIPDRPFTIPDLDALYGDVIDDHKQAYIDALEQAILAPITNAATAVLGVSDRTGRRIPKVMSPELMRIIRAKRQKSRELRRLAFSAPHVHEEMLELSRQYDHEMTRLRNTQYHSFFAEVDQMDASEISKITCSVYTRRARRRATLEQEPEDLESYADFYESQFKTPNGEITTFDQPALRLQDKPIIQEHAVLMAILRMPKGKAPGASKFCTELLKPVATFACRPIAMLFNEIVRLGVVPSSWREALIAPIPKKENPLGIGEHRPISLTEHLRKCFEHCLLGYVTRAVEPLNASQCGFRHDRSTIDQCATLQEIILQFHKQHGKAPEIVFLDIKAAYDSVDRGLLWRQAAAKGVNPFIIRVLRALFDDNRSNVVVANKRSRQFQHAAGLLQGSVLSPVLYSIFIDPLAAKLEEHATLTLANRRTAGLFYADDIALVAESRPRMRQLLQVCEDHSLEHNYRFNPRKCESFAPDNTYSLYGQPVTRCTEFKYLGIYFSQDGINWDRHVEQMIVKAQRAVNFFKVLGANGYCMGERTKLMIYKTFIRSRMEYGLQIMHRYRKALSKLEVAQRRFLASMLDIWPTSNQYGVRTLYQLQTMTQRHDELSCRWGLSLAHKTGEHFLVDFARKASRSSLHRRSAFAYLESDRNPLWNRCLVHELVGMRKWKPLYKEIQQQYLRERIEEDRLRAPHPDAMKTYDNNRAYQAYSLGQEARGTRRLVTLYLTGRLLGKPELCSHCRVQACTDAHMFACSGIACPDNLIKRGRFAEARDCLVLAMRRCFPRYQLYDRLLDNG